MKNLYLWIFIKTISPFNIGQKVWHADKNFYIAKDYYYRGVYTIVFGGKIDFNKYKNYLIKIMKDSLIKI